LAAVSASSATSLVRFFHLFHRHCQHRVEALAVDRPRRNAAHPQDALDHALPPRRQLGRVAPELHAAQDARRALGLEHPVMSAVHDERDANDLAVEALRVEPAQLAQVEGLDGIGGGRWRQTGE
jgi:hypothetical protein